MKSLFVLAALGLAACSEVTAPPTTTALSVPRKAAPEVLVNEKTEFSNLVFFNECSGESVSMSGVTHHVEKLTDSDKGNLKISVSYDTHFRGFGTESGARYEGHMKFEDKQAYAHGDFKETTVNTVRLNGQGKIDDLIMEFKTTITIRDGEVTIKTSDPTTRCKD